MNRRHYTLDTSIPPHAKRLRRIYEDNNIGPFAHALLSTDYVSTGGGVPNYEPTLDGLEETRATLDLAAGTDDIDDEAICTRFADCANTLSDLSYNNGLPEDIAPTLRSLAADVQQLADGILPTDDARNVLDGVRGTVDDIYTILRTLHAAHQHLVQYGTVTTQPPESDIL